jgi:hypothetical protein
MGRRSKRDAYGFEADSDIYVQVGRSKYYVSGDKKLWKISRNAMREVAKGSTVVYLTGDDGSRFKTTKTALYERYYLAAIERIKNNK